MRCRGSSGRLVSTTPMVLLILLFGCLALPSGLCKHTCMHLMVLLLIIYIFVLDTNFIVIDKSRKIYCGAGRPHQLQQMQIDTTPTPVDSAAQQSSDNGRNKVYLNFCISGSCNFFGGGMKNCYCCKVFGVRENCHQSMEECRANCIVCNPKCSPTQLGIGDGASNNSSSGLHNN